MVFLLYSCRILYTDKTLDNEHQDGRHTIIKHHLFLPFKKIERYKQSFSNDTTYIFRSITYKYGRHPHARSLVIEKNSILYDSILIGKKREKYRPSLKFR